jgi:hypothetical protein
VDSEYLAALSKETLWEEWRKALDALCDDRKNPVLRNNLDLIEEEITKRVVQSRTRKWGNQCTM